MANINIESRKGVLRTVADFTLATAVIAGLVHLSRLAIFTPNQLAAAKPKERKIMEDHNLLHDKLDKAYEFKVVKGNKFNFFPLSVVGEKGNNIPISKIYNKSLNGLPKNYRHKH